MLVSNQYGSQGDPTSLLIPMQSSSVLDLSDWCYRLRHNHRPVERTIRQPTHVIVGPLDRLPALYGRKPNSNWGPTFKRSRAADHEVSLSHTKAET